MSVSLVYITASSEEEARAVGSALVEQKLAACVNILPNMTSLYWWEGKVEQGAELVLVAKTRTDLVDRLTREVGRVHSYDVPCVVAVPIQGGNPDFLNWIYDETAPATR